MVFSLSTLRDPTGLRGPQTTSASVEFQICGVFSFFVFHERGGGFGFTYCRFHSEPKQTKKKTLRKIVRARSDLPDTIVRFVKKQKQIEDKPPEKQRKKKTGHYV